MIETIKKVVEKQKKLAIGLMSGTSLDGIDACVVEIKGTGKNTEIKIIDFITLDYTKSEKERILKLCNKNTSSVDEICYMNSFLGNRMGQAAIEVCKKSNIDLNDIDFISSHGQTIYHMPNEHCTLQIGELSNIASVTGCLTVGDFRPSDMAYGGQGAPLVPYIDYLLFSSKNKGRVLLNLGGIGNITVLKANGREDDVYAFDTGPANVLVDEIAKIITDGKMTFDADGKMASMGNIDELWLEEMIIQDEYLCKKPPKSTGREYYTTELAKKFYDDGILRGLGDFDIISTITAFTAKTIQNQLEKFVLKNCKVDEIYVSGGGAHNKMIMKFLSRYTDAEVSPIEKLNFVSDAKESIAFAVLGNEFLHGNANNIPSATGASRDVIMGKLVLPSV